ncbi:hypothetical protein [Beijerinckia indica]|uniref:Uncharacterized protein n=1 Tax=Beijerinckia indica subsp. indica (strain ATCC 9039 / DSM 1715 / NCIMB 8712) TaxID=395963 RepID=B2II11_BEII9|nr:hypothetical protein [Beijerinckia indica]ACB94594.1 hypothetical protein Bind_0948 [Beijerinckia indica subsp. indica ATCC 9039]
MSEAEAPLPQSGARDLLARLYREIGISAVAAALESFTGRSDQENAEQSSVSTVSRLPMHEHDVHKSDLQDQEHDKAA